MLNHITIIFLESKFQLALFSRCHLDASSGLRPPLNHKEGKKGKRNPRSTKEVRRIAAAFFSVKFNQGYPSESDRTDPNAPKHNFVHVHRRPAEMDMADKDVSGGTRKRRKSLEKKKRKTLLNDREGFKLYTSKNLKTS